MVRVGSFVSLGGRSWNAEKVSEKRDMLSVVEMAEAHSIIMRGEGPPSTKSEPRQLDNSPDAGHSSPTCLSLLLCMTPPNEASHLACK